MVIQKLDMDKDRISTCIKKSLLYKTRVEYGNYTMNHVLGCSHGCKYPCYAFLLAKRFKKVNSYEEWIKPRIVENTIELLTHELPRLANRISSVHLCFTTDPFMYDRKDISQLSLESIKLINRFGLKCTTLTKGILPSELKQFSKKNEYGITLISLDETYRQNIEPGAAPYVDRIQSLRNLSEAGFYTWVSIEPYPTPNLVEQNIYDILSSVGFVDKIIFGRCNYNKEVTSYKNKDEFYSDNARIVLEFCEKNNIACHIKTGTMIVPVS